MRVIDDTNGHLGFEPLLGAAAEEVQRTRFQRGYQKGDTSMGLSKQSPTLFGGFNLSSCAVGNFSARAGSLLFATRLESLDCSVARRIAFYSGLSIKLDCKPAGGDLMREVGTFEAKNKLSELLDQVEHGAEIVITRRGKAVAKLVPAQPGFDREKAKRAAAGLRETSKGLRLRGLKIKDLINEGRP
jgi:prevent-host-death family protein